MITGIFYQDFLAANLGDEDSMMQYLHTLEIEKGIEALYHQYHIVSTTPLPTGLSNLQRRK